jgi:dimethylaniline monooxygenase (N-oxide forming)
LIFLFFFFSLIHSTMVSLLLRTVYYLYFGHCLYKIFHTSFFFFICDTCPFVLSLFLLLQDREINNQEKEELSREANHHPFGFTNSIPCTRFALHKMELLPTSVFGWGYVECLVLFASLYFLQTCWKVYAVHATKNHALHKDAHELTEDERAKAKGAGLRVAVIGSGISGVGAIKGCLQAGFRPTCFEADEDVGGFWRYKEDAEFPSVYKCCHIDTDRDLAGYADLPHDPNHGLLISNEDISSYLKGNLEEFGLAQYIRFHSKVLSITPAPTSTDANILWTVTVEYTDPASGKSYVAPEEFDAILVCTGRHGGGAYIPSFKGMSTFQGTVLHSSKYKYPSKHGLDGKNIVVVGCGNSGVDCITDTCAHAKSAYWVCRSGVWINNPGHAEDAFSRSVGETLVVEWIFRLPWWVISTLWETFGVFVNQDMRKDQAILNKHGLTPKHRLFQQHYGIMTGLHADDGRTVHSELENGNITGVKHGIERFTETGVVFTDDPGVVVPVDCVIMATGFKQHCQFMDPAIVDLRWERNGNDVPLYQGVFPIHPSGRRVAFVNFIQSITFLAADLQVRLACRVFKGEVALPPLEVQAREMRRVRDTMCAQHMDRQQLRVQQGGTYPYYREVAEMIGCYPSFSKLFWERPTAFWHAWLTTWSPSQYRLVGPGRLERAERDIELMHHSRYWGVDPRTGTLKPGPMNRGLNPFGPLPRDPLSLPLWALEFPLRWVQMVVRILVPGLLFLLCYLCGYNVSYKLSDRLEDNLQYLRREKKGMAQFGADPMDVQAIGKKGVSVWGRWQGAGRRATRRPTEASSRSTVGRKGDRQRTEWG